MSAKLIQTALIAGSVVIIAAAMVFLGRATVNRDAMRDNGYQTGYSDGYLAALPVGEAQGRQEGRALQEGMSLPAESQQPVQGAFNAGYAAGSNDVFGMYDGGWTLSTPYVITLEQGRSPIVYSINSRTQLEPNVNYSLCPDGHDLCQEPRP